MARKPRRNTAAGSRAPAAGGVRAILRVAEHVAGFGSPSSCCPRGYRGQAEGSLVSTWPPDLNSVELGFRKEISTVLHAYLFSSVLKLDVLIRRLLV